MMNCKHRILKIYTASDEALLTMRLAKLFGMGLGKFKYVRITGKVMQIMALTLAVYAFSLFTAFSCQRTAALPLKVAGSLSWDRDRFI